MPELPEVETIARGLRATLPGRRITAVRLGKTDFIDDPAALERDLPGLRIEKISRYGKFLLLRLSGGNGEPEHSGLLVHLGMTGHLSPKRPEEPARKHTHAVFTLDDGRELRYTDPRRFGRMALLAAGALRETLAPLGSDPLELSEAQFARCVRGRRARIKALLLDQHVLRGLGNIYADESLWRARIHPVRLGAQLAKAQASRLYRAVQHVLREAIRLGGSSISDYLNAEGEPGEFQFRHRAYGREGKQCTRCEVKIRRVLVAGRSSYFCPRCQKAPPGFRPASGSARAKKRAV
ncbi:MAG TPA: bifunctional DNA-formamidopyrimidine glycosylase/DNA-(apurinic or apyrimidinic site) lyase [Candidatus Acidoferrales bacterium]|nr:bifunctional DNA-formamidopyrimidine glycosylase/DNA-(apurinic or apyrimidinic site) lyase [Candidatus Acidoferrales bacterium]